MVGFEAIALSTVWLYGQAGLATAAGEVVASACVNSGGGVACRRSSKEKRNMDDRVTSVWALHVSLIRPHARGVTDRRVRPVGANSPGWAGAAHGLGGPA